MFNFIYPLLKSILNLVSFSNTCMCIKINSINTHVQNIIILFSNYIINNYIRVFLFYKNILASFPNLPL